MENTEGWKIGLCCLDRVGGRVIATEMRTNRYTCLGEAGLSAGNLRRVYRQLTV